MIQKALEEISVDDLVQLVDNKVPEGKTIEYKAELNTDTDADKKEFLYDVTSFANTNGGDLIFGIAEGTEKGIPASIPGISGNMDDITRKIESMMRSSINPRILGLQIKAVLIDGGTNVLILRIAKSMNAPHHVTFKGVDRFYARSNNGKYLLDVFELRNVFLQSSVIADKVRQFVANRISKIISGDAPVRLDNVPKIVLHIVPLQAIEGNKSQISNSEIKSKTLFPIGSGGYNYRYNLEGVLNFSRPPGAQVDYAYVQVYRSGIIESVNADLLRPFDGKTLISVDASFSVEHKIINTVTEALNFLKGFTISPPLYIFLSLLDVKGYGIGSSRLRQSVFGERGIDRDILQLPEIELQVYPDNVPALLREWFEIIWSACGYEKCLSYNAAGDFTGF